VLALAIDLRHVSLVLRTELPGGRGHNTSLVVDAGPQGEPLCAIHDDAQLDYVGRDEDGGYDGAVRPAFCVRGTPIPGEGKSILQLLLFLVTNLPFVMDAILLLLL
jgi:hypothetical protein